MAQQSIILNASQISFSFQQKFLFWHGNDFSLVCFVPLSEAVEFSMVYFFFYILRFFFYLFWKRIWFIVSKILKPFLLDFLFIYSLLQNNATRNLIDHASHTAKTHHRNEVFILSREVFFSAIPVTTSIVSLSETFWNLIMKYKRMKNKGMELYSLFLWIKFCWERIDFKICLKLKPNVALK